MDAVLPAGTVQTMSRELLCLQCPLPVCDESSPSCLIRADKRRVNVTYTRRYYQANRDAILAKKAAQRALCRADPAARKRHKNAVACRRYYRENREKILAQKAAKRREEKE